MGSYLDKPETTKKSDIGENEFLQIGSSSMQVGFFRNVGEVSMLTNFFLI